MKQTHLKAVNFTLMYALSLITAYFTLENTHSTTINIIPGVSGSLPIAALVIISSGIGACGAWFFASWTNKLREQEIKELEDTKSRMKDLETDLSRLKTKKNNILPFMNFSVDKDVVVDKEAA